MAKVIVDKDELQTILNGSNYICVSVQQLSDELSNVDIEETIKQTNKFYNELSKQLGTNGRYKLLNNGKWLDTKERKQLTHKQFVKQLIKIARGK